MHRFLLTFGLLATVVVAQGMNYPDILYYKFNEGAGTAVANLASPGGSSYVPQWELGVGGMWDNTAPMLGGSCMNFAGLDRLQTNWDCNLSNSYTIECWVRTNYDTTAQQPCGSGQPSWCTLGRLWGNYASGMGFFRCYIGFYNNGANFLGGGLPAMNTTTAVVSDTNWHHIALVYDAAAMTATTYVDGAVDQMATGVPPGPWAPGSSFYLGGTSDNATGSVGAPFDGSVDEFRVWSVARTQTEIQNNMNVELTLPIQASFSASTTSGNNPLLVSFTDLSSTTDPGGLTSWAWDFGDGNTSSQQNPCHVYTTSGTFDVTLTITNASGVMDTNMATGFITVGNAGFTAGSCGSGDLFVGAPPPPAGWFEGYTIVSGNTSAPVGSGWFFGLIPDGATWTGLSIPATPGGLFHFLNTNNPAIYPESAAVFPPGSFPTLSGLTFDGVVVYLDGSGTLLSSTSVSRFTF